MLATWKEALNWFFTEGRGQSGVVAAVPAARAHKRIASETDAATTITDVPPTAAADMGKTDWERRLIRTLRSRHYQWRTEQTYRQWAWRFVQWLERRTAVGTDRRAVRLEPTNAAPGRRALPTTLEDATADDVKEFLSDLATRSSVSAST